MLLEILIIALFGAALALRFRLLDLILVSLGLFATWAFLALFGPVSIAYAISHFALNLIALQGGAFTLLLAKSRFVRSRT